MKSSLALRLSSFYDNNSELLQSHYAGLNQSVFFRFINDLETFQVPYSECLLEALSKGTPLDYILGFKFFYQHFFYVNKDVLIPRAETEILVDLCLQVLNAKKTVKMIEVGVGSGALILSLLMKLKNNQVQAFASDISASALEVAKINFFRMKEQISQACRLDFLIMDRIAHDNMTDFDLIVSNPPYIKGVSDRPLVHENTHLYEPHLALYLPDHEYEEWFELFFRQIYRSLKKDGVCLMEGHELHLANLSKIARNVGFNKISLINDFSSRPRFLSLKKD